MASSSENIDEAKSMLADIRKNTFAACNASVNIQTMTKQLEEMEQMKVQVKDKFVETFTRDNLMQSVASPPSEWPAMISQADDEMQQAKIHLREAKQLSENQKNNMLQLNSVVVQGSSLYQVNLDSLKEKLQTLEGLLEEIRKTQKTVLESDTGDSINRELQEWSEALEKLIHENRKNLLHMEHHKAQLDMEVASVKTIMQQLQFMLDEDEERMDTNLLARMLKIITNTESLGDIICHMVDSNTVVIEFPPRPCLSQPPTAAGESIAKVSNGKTDAENDLVLKITMSFAEDGLGYLRLSNMESNLASFDLEDLKEDGEDSTSSLPLMVARIKARWFTHVPLLAEINNLRCRFAIDWIQKENILRVIVGKGGDIVYSLDIPPGYPHQGQVTLSNIIGAPVNIEMENLKPKSGWRLEDWVQHLEETFGKP